MRSLVAVAALAALASAQPPPPGPSTWYGMAPDDTIAGQINLFVLDPRNGAPVNGVATVITSDQEYPKSGTLSCTWGSPMCYFLTGVARPYVSDAIYGVNRTSGATVFKHQVPDGIYLDNLVNDWATDTLYSVAFNPGDRSARIVSYDGTNGAVTILADITNDVAGGFVFGGSVTICPSTNTLYVGVTMEVADGSFGDFLLAYSLAGGAPKLASRTGLFFPIPSGLHAFCNATNLLAVTGDYIQADSDARETLVLGDIQAPGREGFFFPLGRGLLPTFTARGEIPLYLNNMVSEHQGTFLIPIFPPFQPGPGPAPQLPGGLLWSWTFNQGPGPSVGTLSPIGYYLAGAAGVPGR